ncbi:hypothetical protein Tco_1124987 [Tanacetum coccineum]|uniref:Zinc finger, CCHC-type n=1 Tax=Tanacetum coccineum TaxID=301880 RepID=A0ABQ5J7Q0_9ASTR
MSVKSLTYVNLESSSEEHQNEKTPSPPPRKKSLSPPNAPSTSNSSRSTQYTSSSSPRSFAERSLPTHGEFRALLHQHAINARRLPLAPLVHALMTTSVGNNSVFRSFLEKQKLTGPNFIDWYRQLRLVLSTEDKENYLEHPIPEAPIAPPR